MYPVGADEDTLAACVDKRHNGPLSFADIAKIMDMDALTLFCRIADAGGMSVVAREHGQTPSQISRRIRALESELGQRLFERSTRHMRLSEAGIQFLPYAKAILRERQSAVDALSEISGSVSGWLKVAAPEYFGVHYLVPWLARFQEQYPDIHVDLHLADERLDLGKQSWDLAFRAGFPADGIGWYRRFGSYPRFLCASVEYINRFGLPKHPDDLLQHRLILHTATPNEEWYFIRGEERVTCSVDPWVRCNSGSGLLQFVLAGVGVARLTPWIAQSLMKSGRLSSVLPDWTLVSEHGELASFYAVYPEKEPPLKTCLLLDFLQKKMKSADLYL